MQAGFSGYCRFRLCSESFGFSGRRTPDLLACAKEERRVSARDLYDMPTLVGAGGGGDVSAIRQYFDPENINVIEVRLVGGAIQFDAVSDRGGDEGRACARLSLAVFRNVLKGYVGVLSDHSDFIAELSHQKDLDAIEGLEEVRGLFHRKSFFVIAKALEEGGMVIAAEQHEQMRYLSTALAVHVMPLDVFEGMDQTRRVQVKYYNRGFSYPAADNPFSCDL